MEKPNYHQMSFFDENTPTDVLVELLSYKGGCMNRNVTLELTAAKRIKQIQSENERLRSMNQAKLDMIHDLQEEISKLKENIETSK